MVANKRVSHPGRYMVPAPTAEEWSKLSDYEKDRKREQEWLKRSYAWEINGNKIPGSHKWIGDKVLGKGCAVIKRGTYVGSNYIYEKMVVKQVSTPQAKASLQNATFISNCLGGEALNKLPDHIVAPYVGYIEDVGTGTDDTFDPVYVHEFSRETVARMYTPYYEGGNFQQWLDENYSSEYPSEDDVWSVMECLARICMNLEHGNESRDLNPDPKAFQSVVHLDIRPETIFCDRNDVITDGQHAVRKKFSLGKFEKAVRVPPDPADKRWMFSVRGRAGPKWAAPEQKYPEMEGRSISAACNVFGIGALLYYMIKGKQMDDRAWLIGMPGSASNPEVKFCFGGDLLTEPVAEQQEYSKTLLRIIFECLAYLPSDRITAANLRDVSSRATARASREKLKSEIQYTPGDPTTIFQPQEELEPNDYTIEDLTLREKMPAYNAPRDHPTALRARAEKWLTNFWLFPDSTKGQEARDKQREAYEREIERQKQEAAAAEAKKQASIKARAEIHARLRLAEEEEEAARIQLQQKLAEARAKAAQELADLERGGGEQILLPQANNKHDRSPEPAPEAKKRARFDALPVTEGRGSPTSGRLKSILKPSEKGKEKEVVGAPPGNPLVPSIPVSKGPDVSTPAGTAPLSKPPLKSGSTAQAEKVPVAKPPVTSGDIIPPGQASSGLAPSTPAPSTPATSGAPSLPKTPKTSGAAAQEKPKSSDNTAEELRKVKEEAKRKAAEEEAKKAKLNEEIRDRRRREREDEEREREQDRRQAIVRRQIEIKEQKLREEDELYREEEEERERQEEKERERLEKEERAKQKRADKREAARPAYLKYREERNRNMQQGYADERAEKDDDAFKLLWPPLGGASRALDNVDKPSMRMRRPSRGSGDPSFADLGAEFEDNNNNNEEGDDADEVVITGSRRRTPPGGDPYAMYPKYVGSSPQAAPYGMQAAKPVEKAPEKQVKKAPAKRGRKASARGWRGGRKRAGGESVTDAELEEFYSNEI